MDGSARIDDELLIERCARCGHRVASHRARDDRRDYYAQHADEHMDAIAATRRRQARLLVARIGSLLPDADAILDIGSGPGWFLDECRAAGMKRVAGADISRIAVTDLAARGLPAVQIAPDPQTWRESFAALSFRPRVLTLLDVIEHFPASDVVRYVEQAVASTGRSLELVVIKVPVSSGLLYVVASILARLGASGPLRQLYQVGTEPPHTNYFSDDSLGLLMRRCGLRTRSEMRDREFEPETFGTRVNFLRRAPLGAALAVGSAAAALVDVTRRADAITVFATPGPESSPPKSDG